LPNNEKPVPNLEPSWRLPRRDYVLLPAIFLLSMLVMLAGGEVAARMIYVQDHETEPCEYWTEAGFRYQPLCTSRSKLWEGRWVTQHFNDCGYRSAESCGPRPVGALRVVVVGSSTARGALADYPDTFAARGSAALSKRCGAVVDFQNLGTEPSDIGHIDLRMPEALSLHPAAMVMVVGPCDLIHLNDPPLATGLKSPSLPRFSRAAAIELLRVSRLFLMMQYYMYRDPAFQIRAFLMDGDRADYVRTPLGLAWQRNLARLGDLLGRITSLAGPVPVLLFYVPERAQTSLAGSTVAPPGVDPFVLGAALGAVAARHNVRFFDPTKAFAAAPNVRSLFYLTDGHPTAGGHAVLAEVIEQALLSEPAFAACSMR
jgi:hypothetical protein